MHLMPTQTVKIVIMGDTVSFKKVNLFVLNDVAYIWNSKDWIQLRNLRIMGNFIGSVAALPRQDQIAGFPFALLKEEVKLLLEKGYVSIKSLPSLFLSPNDDIKKKYKSYRETILSEQTEILTHKRKQEIESKIDVILKGKKAKKKRLVAPNKDLEKIDKEAVLQEEFNKIHPPKLSALAIQIPTDDPWIQYENFEHYPWDYPNDDTENLRYAVFKNLWEKGYFITVGKKFGGDYIVYPGDPIKFHGFFIVICLQKNEKLQMNDIVSCGRLGHSVRKTVVFAYLNEKNTVCYQSLQWAGI